MAPRQAYLDALIKVLIRYGVAREHIPQQWTPDIQKAALAWIGEVVVQAELNPLPRRKRGRPKGTHVPDGMLISSEGHRKRKERDDVVKKLDRPFILYEKMKRKKIP